MLIDSARRAEAAAKEMLGYVNDGSVSCAEAREALAVCKAFMAAGSAFQAGAARIIAQAERHGDGGTQVLADAAGLSQRDARSQVKTAQVIEAVPAVRDAVESGRVSQANARRLAEAVEKTSAADVASDDELLAKAQSMRPEQFVREARRWTADHQDDGGVSEYRRMRARRCVRIWDGDDGMVHLRGEFDPVTGKRIASRLRAEARRLHDIDKKHTADSNRGKRLTFDQCMADALDNLTNITCARQGSGRPLADICVVAQVDDATGELVAELPDGARLPKTVLEQLACNAKLTGVVYDRKGKPIWRTESRRTVTESQWQLLIAKWGGCFHCGANPGICQGHHIEPASRGGPTNLDNLVPACWTCHHRIHHDGWQIHKSPDGNHTLHPPDTVSFGPARAPDHAPALFKPGTQHDPDPPPPPPRPSLSGGESGVSASPQHEPLFALT
ncbi:MAG: DUF222 domain-containing protein [Acidimicrobiaceae bacterium]|nr:DUF222 domain-containing protein [Acidimicrobiaceae bacterium]MXZ99485.1 DUF222 domain-containing protein [Acidimicrobiaceae bacterium]MYE76484.1 DUF222 domain-containing protein [Acidimicrobiaceae bacterium]MYE97314.1 DUF222 domain-containing protein [Acidimicrobiaceae bacterium]MYH42976.1 DUF222 domain-containing protein [Acidimicrobiaceae bacterium]